MAKKRSETTMNRAARADVSVIVAVGSVENDAIASPSGVGSQCNAVDIGHDTQTSAE